MLTSFIFKKLNCLTRWWSQMFIVDPQNNYFENSGLVYTIRSTPNIIKTYKITHEKPTHKCVLRESTFKTQFKNTKEP